MPPRKTSRPPLAPAVPVAQEAAEQLRRDGRTEWADAVQTVIEHAVKPGPFGNPTPTLSLQVDRAFHGKVQERAQAKGVDVTEVVRTQMEAFLGGKWEPVEPTPRPKGTGGEKTTISVRLPADLVEQVDEAADQLARKRGWSLSRAHKLNARKVAIQALERRFGARRETNPLGWDADYQLLMNVPAVFREYVQEAADERGRHLSVVLREAFARFLGGKWTPVRPLKAPKGTANPLVRMSVQVNEQVRDQVETLGKDAGQASARGYKLSAAQVAVAAFADEFGVPEGLLYPWAE